MKNKIAGIVSLIIVGAVCLGIVAISFIDLGGAFFAKTIDEYVSNPQKGMYVSGGIKIANGPIYTVTHTVNSIPTAKEYYYSVYTDEGIVIYVRASKGFQNKFNNGFSEKPVIITGKMRACDSDTNSFLMEDAKSFQKAGYEVATTGDRILFLDNTMITQSILKILFMFMVVASVILLGVIGGNTPIQSMSGGRKIVTTILVLITLAGLVGLMHTVTFMF